MTPVPVSYVPTREAQASQMATYWGRGWGVSLEPGQRFPSMHVPGSDVEYMELGLRVINYRSYENGGTWSDFQREDHIIGEAVRATSSKTFIEYTLGG